MGFSWVAMDSDEVRTELWLPGSFLNTIRAVFLQFPIPRTQKVSNKMIVPLLTPHFYRASTGVLDDVWDASPGSQTTSKTPVLASLQGNGQNDIYYITGDAWAVAKSAPVM